MESGEEFLQLRADLRSGEGGRTELSWTLLHFLPSNQPSAPPLARGAADGNADRRGRRSRKRKMLKVKMWLPILSRREKMNENGIKSLDILLDAPLFEPSGIYISDKPDL